jgi:hypothetical protein
MNVVATSIVAESQRLIHSYHWGKVANFSVLYLIVEVIYHMMTRDADDYRRQIVYFCIDDLVPANHLLRQIDKAIDWSFIYELVEDK